MKSKTMDNRILLYVHLYEHLLGDGMPSLYLKQIAGDPVFREYPFSLLYRLKQTGQSRKYHPEGNVWNHTLLVVDEAAKRRHESRDAAVFMWAALLHDIGKPDTTRNRNGKITSYNHDRVGGRLSESFLSEFTDDADWIGKIAALIRWHMQILFVVNGLPFADVPAMKRETDINEVALLGLCDRMGRLHADQKQEERNIGIFIEKCRCEGLPIKQRMTKERENEHKGDGVIDSNG